jgi:thioesterase domain-containing protein
MQDHAALARELEDTWHRDIPLAAAMRITVQSYDGKALTVRAPLGPNRNLHGTAFAGSVFSVCVLAGWGAAWLTWRQHGSSGVIVVADSKIQYRRAVTGDLVCVCSPDSAAVAAALEQFRAAGRASLALDCTIDSGERRAVSFTGTYVVQAPRH